MHDAGTDCGVVKRGPASPLAFPFSAALVCGETGSKANVRAVI